MLFELDQTISCLVHEKHKIEKSSVSPGEIMEFLIQHLGKEASSVKTLRSIINEKFNCDLEYKVVKNQVQRAKLQ